MCCSARSIVSGHSRENYDHHAFAQFGTEAMGGWIFKELDQDAGGVGAQTSVTYSGLLHPPSGAERRREASFPSDGSSCV
jgi:hypothetical protein